MENLQRICVLIVIITFAVINAVTSQSYSSGGGVYSQQQSQFQQQQHQPQIQQNFECGIQDKDELPEMHAAAPWAAALFYVDGDIFSLNRQQKYLNAAIFISRNMAITSGSMLLSQQQTELQTKLQLFYGNRASGKQTLIRVRKVEPLTAVRQPLALRIDKSSNPSRADVATVKSSSGFADLYLLHLESAIDITPFSRPICVTGDIFQYKNQYHGSNRSSRKVFLSGYAAKNESVGPHVVYFTGDQEWRVQSWDSDDIKLIMREQQVGYGFLPKHFNAGSGLIIKENHRFYLAGILHHSTDRQTSVRSLEKYVDTLQSKGLDFQSTSDSPQYQQQQPLQQPSYVQNPQVVTPSYGHPNAQYPSPQQPQQQQTNYNPNPSNTNQYEGAGSNSNSAGAQASYLEHIEQSEFEENRRTTSRTTSRPDNVYYAPTSRTPLIQQQQQTIYNPNQNIGGVTQLHPKPNVQQQHQQVSNSYPSQSQPQSYYTSSTTQRNSYLQQQYIQQPNQRPQQVNSQISYPQQPIKCSQEYLEGVDIECLTRRRGVSNIDCIKNAPPNTKIRFSCKPHYVPIAGDKLLEKTCDSSGNWLPRKPFGCKLDCGNVDRTTPYIVHGTKTKSEQWPWHAALFKKVNGTTYSYICGATLIQRSILISAAHCLSNSYEAFDYRDFKVVVGAISSDFLSNRKDPQAQEFNIKEVRINDHYNPRNFEADIALIQLDKPVVLSEFVRPVCFPFPSEDNKRVSSYQLSEGNQGIVVGFGNTEEWNISETLRMASLPVVSVRNCTTVLERLPSSTQYCAGYTNGTGVCEGDSGGAQIFKDQISKRFYVQGIISHGNRKETSVNHSRCDNQKYTVFTKVSSFAEWVNKAVLELEYDYNRRRRRK